MSIFPSISVKYELLEKIGEGQHTVVRKALDKQDNQIYAVKIIEKKQFGDINSLKKFKREVSAMLRLSHDNIVSLINSFEDDQHYYIVMDYCKDGDLFDYLSDNPPLPENIAVYIFFQIVSAVKYCHEHGIAHRDLKPENILFDNFPHIKISDFGLCGFMNSKSKMKSFCGSIYTSAPECLRQIPYDGNLADTYSLGVILYMLVTNEFPWEPNNTPQMLQQILKGEIVYPDSVPPLCRDLISKLTSTDPNLRPSLDSIFSHSWFKKTRFIFPSVPLSNSSNAEKVTSSQRTIFALPVLLPDDDRCILRTESVENQSILRKTVSAPRKFCTNAFTFRKTFLHPSFLVPPRHSVPVALSGKPLF